MADNIIFDSPPFAGGASLKRYLRLYLLSRIETFPPLCWGGLIEANHRTLTRKRLNGIPPPLLGGPH